MPHILVCFEEWNGLTIINLIPHMHMINIKDGIVPPKNHGLVG